MGGDFPGTLERLFGLEYDFQEVWGVSQPEFETFTLGTLGFLLILGVVGYLRAAHVRRQAPAVDDDVLAAHSITPAAAEGRRPHLSDFDGVARETPSSPRGRGR